MWGCGILGTQFKFKINLEGKLVVTNCGELMGAVRLSCPTYFLLIILMQNPILINNHIKPRA